MVDRFIWFCFLALTVITPILFSTQNTELFEVPKMIFVYLLASVLLTLTLAKFALEKKITVPKSPILIAFLIFLLAQLASILISIDKFTSIFGYPSRLNGGLLSQFAYLAILATALVNLNAKKAYTLFAAATITALVVAIWGIPAHFGYDPNCLILTGNLDSTCWQKEFDPTKRIFSTLGQPNWLASYFVLIIPASLALVLISKKQILRLIFSIVSIIIFIAFIFTNSRAGFAGLTIAIVIFALLLGQSALRKNLKVIVPIVLIFAATTIFFGITLISRIGEIIKDPDPTKPSGTESTQIRLIVWQGAIEVFKKYPILGAGPETFAYSYYEVRPLAHNQTTEWNFFYNKAHNEFLNYLAGSGILGLISYLGLLVTIIFTLAKIAKNTLDQKTSLFAKSTIAAALGYQTTIFFGFSVVATQVLFYLFTAAVLKQTKEDQQLNIIIPNRSYQIILLVLTAFLGILLILNVLRIYLSDILVARAKSQSSEDPKLLELYQSAISTFPAANPFYLAQFANESAYFSSTELMENAAYSAQKANNLAPNNLIVLRRVANTYFLLAQTDRKYEKLALATAQRLTQLAPTDPQSYLSLAKIQAGLDRIDDARVSLQKALELKPDYLEAQQLLDQINAKELQ